MNNSLYNQYSAQIRILASIVIILNIIFLFKIFTVQVLDHDKHIQNFNQEMVTVLDKKGKRGKILDRNYKIIADNIDKFDFWVNTTEAFDTIKIALIFSKTFNKPYEHYIEVLNIKNPSLFIEKKVENLYCKNILESIDDINGLQYNSSNQRLYPYDNLASSIVGFSSSTGNNSGLEHFFDKTLSGDEAKVKHKKLDNGKIEYNDTLIAPGKDIVLTIDIEIQSILRSELKKGVEQSDALSGNGVIVDPYTGEILAMASFPDFDPNKSENYKIDYYKNRAISDSYEPGSTFKIVALVAAIEESKITLNDSIDCENGKFILKNGHPLHDHEPLGKISISDVFTYSSNIGMAKISDFLTHQELYNKSRDFGFGFKTGILLPDEQSGMLRHFDDWTYQSSKSIAMGQEISCTSLQLAMAYSSIANGGYLMDPTIIKSIGGSDSLNRNPRKVRKVLSYENSKILLSLLEKVVSEGSGSKAYLSGYSIAGKTGTAQKFIDGDYSDVEYISSFASIFPSNNPEYVCIISIDSPDKSTGKHWGGETAAPIVKNIYKNIVSLKSIKPKSLDYYQNIPSRNSDSLEKNIIDLSVVPNFKGKTLKQAIKESNQVGLKIESSDFSGTVVWQSISPGATLNEKNICKLRMTN